MKQMLLFVEIMVSPLVGTLVVSVSKAVAISPAETQIITSQSTVMS